MYVRMYVSTLFQAQKGEQMTDICRMGSPFTTSMSINLRIMYVSSTNWGKNICLIIKIELKI